jgi:hypothetical protein
VEKARVKNAKAKVARAVKVAKVKAATAESDRLLEVARLEAGGEAVVVEVAQEVERSPEEQAAYVEKVRVTKIKQKSAREKAKATKAEAKAESDRLLEAARVEAGGTDAGDESDPCRTNCCLSCVLRNEPDFKEQVEWLTEVVEKAGFKIKFFPKFHCEFNFIEMIWGWAKSYHRRTCTYNFKDLKTRLPTTLSETMPLAFVRRAARFCFRFMSGYRAGLDGPLLDFTMKRYKSHRSIPLGIVDTVTKDFNDYLDAKALKAKK